MATMQTRNQQSRSLRSCPCFENTKNKSSLNRGIQSLFNDDIQVDNCTQESSKRNETRRISGPVMMIDEPPSMTSLNYTSVLNSLQPIIAKTSNIGQFSYSDQSPIIEIGIKGETNVTSLSDDLPNKNDFKSYSTREYKEGFDRGSYRAWIGAMNLHIA